MRPPSANVTVPGAAGPLHELVASLDRLRARLFAAMLAFGPVAFVLRRRALRIEARAALAILTALLLAVVAPAFMLALGPLVFGVPHVTAEIRYLLVRRGFPRGALVAAALYCAALSGSRLAEQLLHAPGMFAPIEITLAACGTLGAGLWAARTGGSYPRLAALAVLIALAGALSVQHALAARLVFVHLHNFGALLLWLLVFRKRGPLPRVAFVLLAGALALLLSGATLPLSARLGALTLLGVDLARVAAWLTPGVALSIAMPLALVHAFSDSVHYVTWLALIPEEEIRAEGSLTFRMTLRSLRRDLGLAGIGAVGLCLAIVAVGSAFNLAETRRYYFAAAGFHGYLELAALAVLIVRGRRSLT
ncbi:MAG: hypothetical protein U0359_09475 [Byssovorax sp.]